LGQKGPGAQGDVETYVESCGECGDEEDRARMGGKEKPFKNIPENSK